MELSIVSIFLTSSDVLRTCSGVEETCLCRICDKEITSIKQERQWQFSIRSNKFKKKKTKMKQKKKKKNESNWRPSYKS